MIYALELDISNELQLTYLENGNMESYRITVNKIAEELAKEPINDYKIVEYLEGIGADVRMHGMLKETTERNIMPIALNYQEPQTQNMGVVE